MTWFRRFVLAVSHRCHSGIGSRRVADTFGMAHARLGNIVSGRARDSASGELEALDREFASGDHGYVDSMLVIRHGRIAFERAYSHDYDRLFVGKGRPAYLQLLRPGVAPILQPDVPAHDAVRDEERHVCPHRDCNCPWRDTRRGHPRDAIFLRVQGEARSTPRPHAAARRAEHEDRH